MKENALEALNYFDTCIQLIKNKYEFSPKVQDVLANSNQNMVNICTHLPTIKEILDLYEVSFENIDNVPVYGRFGRIFPSMLIRNNDRKLTKVHFGDIENDPTRPHIDKAGTHLALTRVSYDLRTLAPNSVTPEANSNINPRVKIEGKEYILNKFKILGVSVNLSISANYQTLLFDRMPILTREDDIVTGYEIFNKEKHPTFNRTILGNGDYSYIHNNAISNDEYAKFSYFIPNDEGLVDDNFNVIANSLLDKVLEGNLKIDNVVKLMFLQNLANLYMPICPALSKYQNIPDEGNEPVLKLGKDFSSEFNLIKVRKQLGINDLARNVKSEEDITFGFNNPFEFIKGKDIEEHCVVEYQSEPVIVAKTPYSPYEQFFVVCNIGCRVEIEEANLIR